MKWFERRIRRYEHRRWTTDDNRRVMPFAWGLEHIGGSATESNPGEFVRQYAAEAIANSGEWFATTSAPESECRVDAQNVLTFPSSVESAWPENNVVHAQIFPGKKNGAAVLVLPNWNAKWHGQRGLCEWIQRLGITAVKLSMPYHDRRMAKGHERADQICGPNIGLTLQANRQACRMPSDALRWLESAGIYKAGNFGDEYWVVDWVYRADA